MPLQKRKITVSKRAVFWPCGNCRLNCKVYCIQCDSCHQWHHSKCEKMSFEEFNLFEKSSIGYTCNNCFALDLGAQSCTFSNGLSRMMQFCLKDHGLVIDYLEQSEKKHEKGFYAYCRYETENGSISHIAEPDIKWPLDNIPGLKGGAIWLDLKKVSIDPPVLQLTGKQSSDTVLSVSSEAHVTHPVADKRAPSGSYRDLLPRRPINNDIATSGSRRETKLSVEENTDPAIVHPLPEADLPKSGNNDTGTTKQPSDSAALAQPENSDHHTGTAGASSVLRPWRYDVYYKQDRTVIFRLYAPKGYSGKSLDEDELKRYGLEKSFEIRCCHTEKGSFYFEVISKSKITEGGKEKYLKCVRYYKNVLDIIGLPVLVIDNILDYHNELLVRGLIGAHDEKKEKIIYVQFSRFIYNVDLYDFYVYGIFGLVVEQGTDLQKCVSEKIWPWRDENGYAIEPPENAKVKYNDMVNSKTDQELSFNYQELFFYRLGKANDGQFLSDTSGASHLLCKVILAMTYSEAIRNHWALNDNIYLFESKAHIQNIKSFILETYPMSGKGTFRDRKTGFDGITKAYRKRKENFDRMKN